MNIKTNIQFHKLSKIFLPLSSFIFFLCIILIVFNGINTSIDFRGGTIINVSIDSEEYDLTSLRNILFKELNQNVTVVEVHSESSKRELILTMEYLTNEDKIE